MIGQLNCTRKIKTVDSIDNDMSITEESTNNTISIVPKQSEDNYASSFIQNFSEKEIIPCIQTHQQGLCFDMNEYNAAKGLLALTNEVMKNEPYHDIIGNNSINGTNKHKRTFEEEYNQTVNEDCSSDKSEDIVTGQQQKQFLIASSDKWISNKKVFVIYQENKIKYSESKRNKLIGEKITSKNTTIIHNESFIKETNLTGVEHRRLNKNLINEFYSYVKTNWDHNLKSFKYEKIISKTIKNSPRKKSIVKDIMNVQIMMAVMMIKED